MKFVHMYTILNHKNILILKLMIEFHLITLLCITVAWFVLGYRYDLMKEYFFTIVEKDYITKSETINLIKKEQDCEKHCTIWFNVQIFGHNLS